MHEVEKIREAEDFYSRMKDDQDTHREGFDHNLSAFLSAARSVLDYALREAQRKPGGRHWYDSHTSKHATLKFFKVERDRNIHKRPVKARQHLHVNIETITEAASVASQGAEASPWSPRSQGSISVKQRFFFDDWPDNEDVLTVCRCYLDNIKKVVDDGRRKGLLS